MVNKIIKLDNGVHWGKEVTEDGKFVKFVADPNKKPYREICREWLEKAESIDNNSFVQSLRKQYNSRHSLSPKQLDCLKNIYERCEMKDWL